MTTPCFLKEGGGSRKDREKGKGEHIAHGLRNGSCSCAAAFRFMQRRLVSKRLFLACRSYKGEYQEGAVCSQLYNYTLTALLSIIIIIVAELLDSDHAL